MKHIFCLYILFLSLMGCQLKSQTISQSLTTSEKNLCDSLHIDTTLIKIIRTSNTSALEPFHYSRTKMYKDDKETEVNPIHLDGVIFREPYATSTQLVEKLFPIFHSKGYSIFVLEQNFNLKNQPDEIAVLKTPDKMLVLRMPPANPTYSEDKVSSLDCNFLCL
jgi:hypothetical protein